MSNVKHKCRVVGRIKALTIVNISQRIRPYGATLYQKVKIFAILGRVPTPGIDLREISVIQADPPEPRLCQISHESVQRVVPAGRKC